MTATPPNDYFTAELSQEGDATVCRLSGDLSLASAPYLEQTLAGVLRPGLRLVIDLADLDFVDSTGLATFVTVRKRAVQEGFAVSIRLASENVRRTLQLVGLGVWLDYAGPDEASPAG